MAKKINGEATLFAEKAKRNSHTRDEGYWLLMLSVLQYKIGKTIKGENNSFCSYCRKNNVSDISVDKVDALELEDITFEKIAQLRKEDSEEKNSKRVDEKFEKVDEKIEEMSEFERATNEKMSIMFAMLEKLSKQING